MNKPDWKDAPEGAQFLAREANGYWYWYADEPSYNGNTGRWGSEGKDWMASTPVPAKDTLERRP